MASLHRNLKKSQNWNCSFYDPATGKWCQRSTGTSDKALAMESCLKFEAMAKAGRPDSAGTIPAADSGELLEAGMMLLQVARKGQLGEEAAREFVNRVMLAAQVEAQIEGATAKDFLMNWLEGRRLSKSVHTANRYRTTIEMFIKFLGPRGTTSIAALGAKDVERYRNYRLKEVSAGTVADDLKILRTAFNTANRQGIIRSNPVEAVDFPASETQSREAFTPAEVGLLIKAAKDDQWRVAIMFGAYAGCRLSDAVKMDWSAVNFDTNLLRYRQQKTKKLVEMPLHKVLLWQLKKMAGDTAGRITPRLAVQSVPGRSGLSRQFLDIVKEAGVDTDIREVDKTHKAKRRHFTGKSFHSLRSSFVSAMANAGVAPEIRQKLSGHTTEDAHQRYTKLEMDPLRKAIDSIPSK
jgi:integrase